MRCAHDAEANLHQRRAEDDRRVRSIAQIVGAFVASNHVQAEALANLIHSVAASIDACYTRTSAHQQQTVQASRNPAVPIGQSVTDDWIICLEDGGRFKSLKRHLSSHYNLTPEEYRTRWQLPVNYPMVAPSYARKRSILAKKSGLGKIRQKSRSGSRLQHATSGREPVEGAN